MKIKTIVHDHPDDFDDLVNEALEDGYILEHRGTLQGTEVKVGHYARLVLLDPLPATTEHLPLDPIEALHAIKDFCEGVSVEDCCSDRCPLYDWCTQLRRGGDPTDWKLPEKEAPEV